MLMTFQSATGKTVTIKSSMGEDSARSAAMEYFWGPSRPWQWCKSDKSGDKCDCYKKFGSGFCENKGLGLDLVAVVDGDGEARP
jgi:hypothetical protein